MDSSTLSRDIENLSLDLLLTPSEAADADSITTALLKLAAIVDKAQTLGASALMQSADKLRGSVDSVKDKLPPQDLLPLIIDGLKSLGSGVELAASGVSTDHAEGSQPKSLGQDRELLQDFVLEALEHLGVLEAQLLLLEENPQDSEPTHACFRALHTIKGVAGFLELNRIREVAHEGETLLDELRNGKVAVTAEVIDTLLETEDFLRKEVAGIESSLVGNVPSESPEYQNLILRLRSARTQSSERALEAPASDRTILSVTEATTNSPAEAVEQEPQSGDAPEAVHRASAGPSVEGRKQVHSSSEPRFTEQKTQTPSGRSVKVEMEKLDYLADMVGELVVTQSMLRLEGIAKCSAADNPLTRNLSQLARITAEVQKTAMGMRMVQIGHLFQRLARVVRDVSRQAGKTVELDISGDEIELDRSIVEELSDPLMHMVRNSIDHGIETPQQREAAGKDASGRISLKARHDAGQVQIEVSDDGRGLDRERILAKARERGLVEGQTVLSDAEILNLIFEPGFSTAEKVTDLSGRGVGMDVVRKQIQKLRGRVELHSAPGKGSTFVLRLPLTLAIIEGLVVRVGSERYVVPLSAVREVLQPAGEMIFTVQGRGEMAMIRQTLLPITRLYRSMNVKPGSENLLEGILIVIEGQSRTYCLAVDELLGKQEVVIKSLGAFMQSISGIAGGVILGDGHIGLILDPDAFARRSTCG